jgi:hypothetical protein
MMIVVGYFLELRDIKQSREIVEVEHRIVFAVFAKERDVFAEIHILEMIGDKAAVAPLYPLTEYLQNLWICRCFHPIEMRFYHTGFGRNRLQSASEYVLV